MWNKTAEVAQAFRSALLAGGWAGQGTSRSSPVDDTAYLIATWLGSDPALMPVMLSAHMDVVEAKPEDWERDLFTPVVENGYLFGRGASGHVVARGLAGGGLADRAAEVRASSPSAALWSPIRVTIRPR